MKKPPNYFESIRENSINRWNQLEADPELAGPWRQLFKQVQSPRHVLSELLQNADDAGAIEASVNIEKNEFIFRHNGEDFSEEHFASLCRFAYSNKRTLHTIGFRGIGFKSIFSLGDTVFLITPTLSVAFHSSRFTEPVWREDIESVVDQTEIRIAISDPNRQFEVKKNLEDWRKSPLSLLFFKNIRCISIESHELRWNKIEMGPVENSEWMVLAGSKEDYLIVRSSAEPFPNEAVTEIRQERLMLGSEDIEFPPCSIEIVLGLHEHRTIALTSGIYVVLPTGVRTGLPFACNGPFIQDPARLKIKDPETSPTNRWLLNRVGKLAASAMLFWLQQTDFGLFRRAKAYVLFPDNNREDNALEGTCATIVKTAFREKIDKAHYLLTENGALKPAQTCSAIPDALFDIWSVDQLIEVFSLDTLELSPLYKNIEPENRRKLINWRDVKEFSKPNVFSILKNKCPPKPQAWPQLFKLWEFLKSYLTDYAHDSDIRIIPVQGKNVLYSAKEIICLGKIQLQSDEDWNFLSKYLLIVDQNWINFLPPFYSISQILKVSEPTDVNTVISRVVKNFFKNQPSLENCVRLTQIAAKLEASVDYNFKFFNKNGQLVGHKIIFNESGFAEEILEPEWFKNNTLNEAYTRNFTSCTKDEWQSWIFSGRSRLRSFIEISRVDKEFRGRTSIQQELRKRGCQIIPNLDQYKSDKFSIGDYDFEDIHWRYWFDLEKKIPKIWELLISQIFIQPEEYWANAKSAKAIHVAKTSCNYKLIVSELLPSWLIKLRERPCLIDTKGKNQKPEKLMLRTPETEPFLDIEPFLESKWDTEKNRPLLKLLGVQDKPTSPKKLLERLRALAQVEKPPIREVERWYERLDQMLNSCSTSDFSEIKKAFSQEKIILTQAHGWAYLTEVFLSTDEDIFPSAAVIRDSVQDLSLWCKVGVAERPTDELAIRWLKSLCSDRMLSQGDTRRVQALLPRYAERIWKECRYWLNLAGEWVPIDNLEYTLTKQTSSSIDSSRLFTSVKQKTADLYRLSPEVIKKPPFSDLPLLANHIEKRLKKSLALFSTKYPVWLNRFGAELRRIKLEGEEETIRIRRLAERLAETSWQCTLGLETVPYLNDMPAGTAQRTDAVWLDKTLYVEDRSIAKLAPVLSQELGRIFGQQDITDALKYCVDRSPEFITEYLEENFNLVSIGAVEAVEHQPTLQVVNEVTDSTFQHQDEILFYHKNVPFIGDKNIEITQDVAPDFASIQLRKTKLFKLPLIERFARSLGYQKDIDHRFYHSDGSWIGETIHSRFPWERRSTTGELLYYCYPMEKCFEQNLEIQADIWEMLDKFPKTYVLILTDPFANPVEISGYYLQTLRTNGRLKIYPATYRLVFSHEDDE